MSTTIVGTTPTQREARPAFRRLRRGQVIGGVLLLALLIVVILAALGEPLWQLLGTGILLLSVVVVVLLALGALVIALFVAALTRKRTRILPWLERFFRLLLVLGILLLGVASAVVGSQWHASTPPILGTDGQPLPGSIATMEQITLNGSQQWITIRGTNIHNPLLLVLAGGPGESGLTGFRMLMEPLEEHFVVVNWDQPGAGKSYGAVPIATLTPQRYIADAHALIQLVRTRFHQDKIYLMGGSWGSILGIWLVQQYPNLFYAFIGHGQMVNVKEDDIMGYQFALKYAASHGDTATVDTLRRNGPPPYVGSDWGWKYLAFQTVLFRYMAEHAGATKISMVDELGSEYGLLDKVNFFRGLYDVPTVMLPQMESIDFTAQANRLQVPVYFLLGRWDVNAMSSLVEQYYNVLQAPHKELIWFEQSGHTPMAYEPNKVVDVIVNHVLPQTWPGR
jgi:pimeloyl-ACP methyl ester carboxylesterase